MVLTVIEAIRINVVTEQHVVILKEVDGSRIVPIWIDPYQAQSIALEIQGAEISRPMTHDLLMSVIKELGGSVDRIVINDLKDSTFYALIEIDAAGRPLSVDSRPSDAIALAVRAQSAIYIEDHVIEQAGVSLPDASGPDAPAQEDEPVENEADRERLSVFRDFINSLEVEDKGDDE